MSDAADQRRCCMCEQYKPVTEFYTNRANISGYHTVCKDCDKARKYARYHADPDVRRYHKEYSAEWRKRPESRELRNAQNRRYRAKKNRQIQLAGRGQ